MTNNIAKDLKSALYKLFNKFSDDPFAFHFAISLVFSSIFKNYGIKLVIVGGQSVAYWNRINVSQDADFISDNNEVTAILESIGFSVDANFRFRLLHEEFNAFVEIVGESLRIAGIDFSISDNVIEVFPSDIDDELVASLMKANALILHPALAFLNYIHASIPDTEWFDSKDGGSEAGIRAKALYRLLTDEIEEKLININKMHKIPENIKEYLRLEYQFIL